MIHLDINISEKEKEILIKVLESYISDLNMEIADTDQMDFRDKLKSERTVLRKFIREIRETKIITE